ncbi:MAG: hypothetical protein AAF683_03160 [Pseudomonadota bacterium]
MKKGMLTKAVASALVLASLATSAAAKDWIEYLNFNPAGLDTEKIIVRANINGYTTTTTSSKTFQTRIDAKAKSGRRINGLMLEAGWDAHYFEWAGSGVWNYYYSYSEVGKGTLRQRSWNASLPLSLLDVKWHGRNPVEECNHNLAQKMSDGWSKEQVLAEKWQVSTGARFSAALIVTRPSNVTSHPLSIKKTKFDHERTSLVYPVYVECLSVPGLHNTIAPPTPKTSTLLLPRDRRDDNDRPARRPSSNGGDTRDGGSRPPARDPSGGRSGGASSDRDDSSDGRDPARDVRG